MIQGRWALGFVLGISTWSARTWAAESEAQQRRERFGDKKQIAIAGNFNIGADQTLGEYGTSKIESTTLVVAPAADVFVSDRLSLGGQLTYVQSSTSAFFASADYVSIGLAPRIGYALPLSELWSLYPRVSLGDDRALGAIKTVRVTATAFVRVLAHLAQHFFLGAGPFISHVVLDGEYDSDQQIINSHGVRSTIGGYF